MSTKTQKLERRLDVMVDSLNAKSLHGQKQILMDQINGICLDFCLDEYKYEIDRADGISKRVKNDVEKQV